MLSDAEQAALMGAAAEAAVKTEQNFGVPAEFCLAHFVLESGWGAKMSGRNNPFSIRARPGEPGTDVTTTEFLTSQQLDDWRQKGRKILSVGTLQDGRFPVLCVDTFADYPSLDDAFAAYGVLVTTGQNFKPSWDAFLADVRAAQTAADLSAARDKYLVSYSKAHSTAPDYLAAVRQLIQGARLTKALGAARQSKAGATFA